ncbi:MAG: hypothetical protein [Bacteriophage sp.]|nr:MAG: hypothetical protein [Bacteriophage sp.]
MATKRIMRTRPMAVSTPATTGLLNVRLTDLGHAIERVEDEAQELEAVYLRLRDTDPGAATTIRLLLEATDLLLQEYSVVR